MMRPTIALAWPKDDYVSALERAGATPRIVNPEHDSISSVLDGTDGLLLTGGADVDPRHYGDDSRHPTLCLEPARDEFELGLARAAMARDLPILAICRGVQLLNVAAGGTLIQDLPSEGLSTIAHGVKEPVDQVVHTVSVEHDSRLFTLLGRPESELPVNSRHHQAVKAVAPGFRPVAKAADGVVEAIENPDASFCVGVQWHPENFWRTGRFSSLFEGFVDAARQRLSSGGTAEPR